MDEDLGTYVRLAREYLAYDPETGVITRKLNTANVKAGDRAGTLNKHLGYRYICFRRRYWPEHRMIFLLQTGHWPVGEIDHINGKRDDNRWCNLRDIPLAINRQNLTKPGARNTSGFMGVSRHRGRWRATIALRGKQTALGYFDTREEAHDVYLKAKRRIHLGCTI